MDLSDAFCAVESCSFLPSAVLCYQEAGRWGHKETPLHWMVTALHTARKTACEDLRMLPFTHSHGEPVVLLPGEHLYMFRKDAEASPY